MLTWRPLSLMLVINWRQEKSCHLCLPSVIVYTQETITVKVTWNQEISYHRSVFFSSLPKTTLFPTLENLSKNKISFYLYLSFAMGGQLSSDEFEKTDLLLHVEQLNVDCFSLSGPKQKKQKKKPTRSNCTLMFCRGGLRNVQSLKRTCAATSRWECFK